MKNKLISIFMALTFCFLSSFCFCSDGFSIEVHAESEFPMPDVLWKNSAFTTRYPSFDYETSCSNFYTSFPQYDPNSTFLVFGQGTALFPTNKCYVFVFNRDGVVSSSGKYIYIKDYPSTLYYTSNFINYSDNNGNLHPQYPRSVCYDTNADVYYYCTLNTSGGFQYADTNNIGMCIVNETFPPPFVPSHHTLYGLDLSINETSFYEWIIENNKLSELPSYITQSKLLSFISFYNNFGSNFGNFLKNIPDWFSHMNIVNQTSENVNILKSAMDRLYQEYFNSFWVEVGYPNATNLPHHRRNIQTQTTDDDTSLITDDSSDTLDISILRDILRGIIQVSNQIGDGTNSIINKLGQLDFTVNLTNGGGSSVTDLSVLYEYDINDFNDDFITFEENVSDITALPLSYVQTINNNPLMPENMLSDKQSLSVTIPVINGFTVNSEGTQYETNTDTYTLNSTDYPWLDTIVKKMKRFASIMLIIGYLIHLRFKIADIVRGE